MLPKQYARILYELTNGKDNLALEQSISEFVKFLIKQRVLSKKEYIIDAFLEYANFQDGIQKITITSTRKLSDTVIKKISVFFGNRVEVKIEIDRSLIGGVVVRSGDIILDASVKRQLEKLQKQLS